MESLDAAAAEAVRGEGGGVGASSRAADAMVRQPITDHEFFWPGRMMGYSHVVEESAAAPRN